ncbi:MAG: LssY C-terminal domain-containing protein [Pseudomonadota bacterium]
MRVLPCLAALLLAAVLLSGCATGPAHDPAADQNLPMQLGRIQRLEQDGVTVEVSIPTDDDASHFFGVALARHDIQPIWLRIDNATDVDYWLMPIAVDPDYYSPDEAALVTGAKLPRAERSANRLRFRSNALSFFTPAHTTHEGYIYASYKRGGRFIDVRLSGHRHAVRMRFAMLLPTESFDYEKSALRNLYEQVDTLPDLTAAQLRAQLRTLPCCTTTASGTGEGDPLNLVLVGRGEDVVAALTASGWDFTEAITIDSIRRMIGAAIEETAFPTAPVSSLYALGRKQDLALQRGRSTISQRNHMRLWLAPFRCEGEPVWIGQVSRDIGVKMTAKSASLTTHVIDPVVDEAREYLFHSLLHHDAISRFGFVQGVGVATEAQPRHNLTDDPYITDGMRMVLWVSRQPLPPHLAQDLGWNESADPILEGKGEQHMIPALLDQ